MAVRRIPTGGGGPWPPGAEIGVHTHANDNEEIYVIVGGSGVMYLDGDLFMVGAGDVVINAPGGTHGLRNTSDADLKLIVIEIPATSAEAGR